MASFDAGSIVARLELRRDQFEEELKRAGEEGDEFARREFVAAVALDRTKFAADVDRVNEQLQAIADRKVDPKVELEKAKAQADVDEMQARLDRLGEKKESILVSVQTGMAEGALAALQERLDSFDRTPAEKKIDIEEADAILKIREVQARLEELSKLVATPKVEADTAKAMLDLDRLSLKLDEIGAKREHATVDVDTKDAASKLDSVGRSADNAGKSASGASSGFLGLSGMTWLIGGAATATGPALGLLASALAYVPGVAAAGGAGMMTFKLGVMNVSDALKNADTPAQLKKVQQAMDQLSPSARATVVELNALKPALRDIQQTVQENLFAGMADQVKGLNGLLPIMKAGLGGVATGLNDNIKGFLGVVSSAQGMTQINSILAGTADFFHTLTPAVRDFTSNFLTMASVGTQSMHGLAVELNNAAAGFRTMIQHAQATGQLAAAFDGLNKIIGALANMFTQLMGQGIQLGAMFNGPLAAALNIITGLLQPLQPLLIGLGNLFFSIVGPAIAALTPVVAALSGPLGQLATILGQFLAQAIALAAPYLAQIAAMLGQFLQAVLPLASALLTALLPVLPLLIQSMMLLLSAIMPIVTAALPPLTAAIQFLSPIIGPLVAGIVAWTAVQWLLNTALLANPIGLVIIAVVALVGVVALIIQNWGPIAGFFERLWDGIKHSFIDTWEQIRTGAVQIWTAVISFLTNIWTNVRDGALQIWGGLAAFFTGLWTGIRDGAVQIWSGIRDFFVTIWNGISTLAITVWNAVTDYFHRLFEAHRQLIMQVWTAISSFFTTIWNGIRDTAVTIWNAISSFFTAAWNAELQGWMNIWNAVSTFFTTIWNGIRNTAVTVWNAIVAFFTPAWNALSALWSSIWNGVSSFFTTIWNGIRGVAISVWNAISAFFTAGWNAMVGVWNTVWNTISGFFTTIWNGIRAQATILWNAISSFFTGAWNALAGAWNTVWGGISRVFTDVWNGIKGTAISIWDGITGAVRAGVNGVIDAADWMVNGVNKVLSFLLIPTIPTIPKLAAGGIVGLEAGGTLPPLTQPIHQLPMAAAGTSIGPGFMTSGPQVVVGEGNPSWPEYVIPTDPMYRDRARGLVGDLTQTITMADGGIVPPPPPGGGGVFSTLEGLAGSAAGYVAGATGLTPGGAKVGSEVGGLVGGAVGGGIDAKITAAISDSNEWISHAILAMIGGIGDAMGKLIPAGLLHGAGGWLSKNMVDAVSKMVDAEEAKKAAAAAAAAAATAGPGAAVNLPGGVNAWVDAALALTGHPEDKAGILQQIQSESGGNPNAVNNTDSNAVAGHPSQGILQMIPTTFAAHMVPGHANILNPVDNIASADNYGRANYGAGFWAPGPRHNTGYAAGGVISYDSGGQLPPGLSTAFNGTGQVESVSAGGYVSPPRSAGGAPGGGAGPAVHVHIDVHPAANHDEAAIADMINRKLGWALDL